MYNQKHRRSILILFLSLTVSIGMIVPAAGRGNALVTQPFLQITVPWAGLSEPLAPGTYDDPDSHLAYTGNWEVQTGVTGVRNGTLHLSNTPGDKVEFQFIGNELRVFFQAGPNLGAIRLTIDNDSYVMDETNSSILSYEWVIVASDNDVHNVTITHESGGPVNLDGFIVPILPCTPTPGLQTFVDVPASHPYYQDIEILYAKGLTAGCSTNPLKYCPDQTMSRAQAAVFILRTSLGPGYVPKPPTHIFTDDWDKGPWAESLAEGMKSNCYSAGCLAYPLKYCPWNQIPREQVVIFILKLKYGKEYIPPAATGTLFADMTDPSFYATSWAEQAYKEELIPDCGKNGSKPKFCPEGLVSRGLAADMIVRARNLSCIQTR